MFKKITLWGSITSIITFILYFLPFHSEVTAQTTTTGEQSPAIGENQGNVTINYGTSPSPHEKSYVLRHRAGGASVVVSDPGNYTNVKSHVCMAPAGTPITLTGETEKTDNIFEWRKVKIMYGECANKIGWVALDDISLEK